MLRLIAVGHSNKEVAAQLKISVKTVEVHKANAMRKLGLAGPSRHYPVRRAARLASRRLGAPGVLGQTRTPFRFSQLRRPLPIHTLVCAKKPNEGNVPINR